MFIVMCCGSLLKLPCVPQLDTPRAIDCFDNASPQQQGGAPSRLGSQPHDENASGAGNHLTWISCWIASQGHRSALWPNVVPSETGPTDLETARRLVPTLVHGLGAQSCQGSGGS